MPSTRRGMSAGIVPQSAAAGFSRPRLWQPQNDGAALPFARLPPRASLSVAQSRRTRIAAPRRGSAPGLDRVPLPLPVLAAPDHLLDPEAELEKPLRPFGRRGAARGWRNTSTALSKMEPSSGAAARPPPPAGPVRDVTMVP